MAPPKSEAERRERNKRYCQQYRQKNKEKYRKRDAERKTYERAKLKLTNPELYELKKAEDRDRAKLYRMRKKLNLINPEKDTTNENENNPAPSTSFTTKQALSRSVNKVQKALPFSPRKKSEVIGKLAQKLQLRIAPKGKRGRKSNDLSDEQIAWIEEFLNRSDVTYMNPGRKDNVYIGKVNGERKYEQKRYLLWTIRDLLEIINGGNGEAINGEIFREVFDCSLTFTQLYNYLKSKKQYIYNKYIPHGSCLCEICENAMLMAKEISKGLQNDLKDVP